MLVLDSSAKDSLTRGHQDIHGWLVLALFVIKVAKPEHGVSKIVWFCSKDLFLFQCMYVCVTFLHTET